MNTCNRTHVDDLIDICLTFTHPVFDNASSMNLCFTVYSDPDSLPGTASSSNGLAVRKKPTDDTLPKSKNSKPPTGRIAKTTQNKPGSHQGSEVLSSILSDSP